MRMALFTRFTKCMPQGGIRIGYITRGRSLRELHTRGPQARGNVNHVETDS